MLSKLKIEIQINQSNGTIDVPKSEDLLIHVTWDDKKFLFCFVVATFFYS